MSRKRRTAGVTAVLFLGIVATLHVLAPGQPMGQPATIDARLSTDGVFGTNSFRRSFEPFAGARIVSVRYRFSTQEIPAGYFGTEFDDSFSVMIAGALGSNIAIDESSMNRLGRTAFNAAGETDWRELSREVGPGESVDFLFEVTNADDELYDAQLHIDFIDVRTVHIADAKLFDIETLSVCAPLPVPLRFVSADDFQYVDPAVPAGIIPIHGTIQVEGAEADSLTSLELEVVQGRDVKAVAPLTPGLSSTLLTPFGPDERVEVNSAQRFFDLPRVNGIDTTTAGLLQLRVVARSASLETATRTIGLPLPLLIQYKGVNRFAGPKGRDIDRGGDDWAKHHLIDVANHFATQGHLWNDFSNLHAECFRPDHTSHKEGIDVDGTFGSYNPRGLAELNGTPATTAAGLLAMLRDPMLGDIIDRVTVLVAYRETSTDAFFQQIQGQMVGAIPAPRPADEVIQPDLPARIRHDDHYHLKWS